MENTERLRKEYTARINKAVDYIENNLDKSMTLEELASAANFSKFHFNRLFHSFTGETPFRFIMRLRLERAAALILAGGQKSITDISFRCGFQDVAVFSRNFKSFFGIPASKYKNEKLKNSNFSKTNSNAWQGAEIPPPYFCHETNSLKWRTKMELNKSIEVKETAGMTVAYIRNTGPWNGDRENYQKLRSVLFSWAGAKGLLGRDNFKYLILYHDNPDITGSDKLRMSLCVTVPPETSVDGEIGKLEIEAAKCAVGRFELTANDFQRAWEWMFGVWLPGSGFQPDDKPYYETYPEEPKGEKFIVDFCIPVKPLY